MHPLKVATAFLFSLPLLFLLPTSVLSLTPLVIFPELLFFPSVFTLSSPVLHRHCPSFTPTVVFLFYQRCSSSIHFRLLAASAAARCADSGGALLVGCHRQEEDLRYQHPPLLLFKFGCLRLLFKLLLSPVSDFSLFVLLSVSPIWFLFPPTTPPPSQAVRWAKNEVSRGGGLGTGY